MRYFKWGIELFNTDLEKYGGHSRWVQKYLSRDINMVVFFIEWNFEVGWFSFWYDWQHHVIRCGPFGLYWQGVPYRDMS